jgi:hypothetical protein
VQLTTIFPQSRQALAEGMARFYDLSHLLIDLMHDNNKSVPSTPGEAEVMFLVLEILAW